MLCVNLQVFLHMQKGLDELVDAGHILKTVKRNGVLHSGVMGVKGDDIIHTHGCQFLEHHGAVQRFSAGTLVLAAFIQKRHDHRDTARFSAYGGNNPLQILKVIVRGHVVYMAAQRISEAVVADIHHDVEVVAADRLVDNALCLAAAKAGDLCVHNIRILLVSFKSNGGFIFVFPFPAPVRQIVVHFFAQLCAAVHRDQAQRAYWNRL